MPAGKRVYIKSAATRKKTGKKYFRVKNKTGTKYRPSSMSTRQPITRRRLHTIVKHQYQNTGRINAISWSQLYTGQGGSQRNVNQRFSLNSMMVFAPGGNIGSALTGNNVAASTYITWAKPVLDNYNLNNATTMPGYSDLPPFIKNNYNHYQVLGTKITFTFRAVHAGSSVDTDDQTLPLRINLTRVSSNQTLTATKDTEGIQSQPYTQSKIILGLDATANKSCSFNLRHSPAKFNGVRKGQFVGDGRYLGTNVMPQINGLPEEEDFLILSVSPLSSQFASGTAVSIKTPTIFVSMKMEKWVKYTDPTSTNNMAVANV